MEDDIQTAKLRNSENAQLREHLARLEKERDDARTAAFHFHDTERIHQLKARLQQIRELAVSSQPGWLACEILKLLEKELAASGYLFQMQRSNLPDDDIRSNLADAIKTIDKFRADLARVTKERDAIAQLLREEKYWLQESGQDDEPRHAAFIQRIDAALNSQNLT